MTVSEEKLSLQEELMTLLFGVDKQLYSRSEFFLKNENLLNILIKKSENFKQNNIKNK